MLRARPPEYSQRAREFRRIASEHIPAQRRAMIRLITLLCMTVIASAADPLVWKQLPSLPDPLGVAGPFAGVSGTSLVVAGGANFPDKMPWEGGKKVWHDRVWVLDKPDGTWREAGKLPRPLGYGVSVTARGGVVCVGGSDAQRHYADTFLLSTEPDGFHVKPLAPLPIPLANMTGALMGDDVYIVGGAEAPGEQAATNRAFVLSLKDNAWRELEPLPGKARILATGATNDGKFFVFGGVALSPGADRKVVREYLRDAWRYEAGKGWIALATMPKAVAAAPSPAPIVGERVWILGGDDGSRAGFQPIEKHPGFVGEALSFPVDTRIRVYPWESTDAVKAPRATVPVVQWNGLVVIPSGEVRPGVRSPEVWSVEVNAVFRPTRSQRIRVISNKP